MQNQLLLLHFWYLVTEDWKEVTLKARVREFKYYANHKFVKFAKIRSHIQEIHMMLTQRFYSC